MSDRPVFIYAATYTDRVDAFADYESLLELHAAKLVGTYDVALIVKDADGKVHVSKHEKPTQHGAWGGIAVGALVGVIFPPRSSVRRWSAALSAASAVICARASDVVTPRSSGRCWTAARLR